MKRGGLRPRVAGVSSGIEQAIRFVLWAQQLLREPTIEQIRSQFDISRAAAFRWRAAWRAAQGKAAPTKERTS